MPWEAKPLGGARDLLRTPCWYSLYSLYLWGGCTYRSSRHFTMHWTWQKTGFCLLPWGLGEVKWLLGIKWKPLNRKNIHLPQGTGLESSEMILVSDNHYIIRCLSSFKV